ncbi:cell wall glucanase [Triangularia verruculosa]|uniref:Cell wall glucanase n=1 Tax=Triangularia verruculosa TaxID=2587418 RepID=A0AAN6XNI1_9PEZI|nr:cell wall glucanase [Triangularia verruculosa]
MFIPILSCLLLLPLPIFATYQAPYARQAIAPGGKHHHGPSSPPTLTLLDNSASHATDIPQIILVVVDPNNNNNNHDSHPVVSTSTSAIRISNPSILPSLPEQQPRVKAAAAGEGLITGVTYAPYNGDGTCRTASQVYADFQRMHNHPSGGKFDLVRIYGVDCDQVASVLPAAHSISVKLFLGIFELDNLGGQVRTLVDAVRGSGLGWGIVDTISVANELVNNGQASPSQVIGAVRAAREMLRSAGYAGPVVTVDTFVAVERHPELCDESDYCAINCHPFFDGYTPADKAGGFVGRKVRDVKEVLRDQGKRIVVTEAGWPWQGGANNRAVPGREEQRRAVKSIREVWERDWRGIRGGGGLFLFTAFDDPWKRAEEGTFYAEQFWGME